MRTCIDCSEKYRENIKKRILEKSIKQDNGCVVFNGAKNAKGYGLIYISKYNSLMMAHRAIYEVSFGEIPKNNIICHACDNPSCVNVSHLFVGTNSDNMIDMYKKKRGNKHPKKHAAVCILTEDDVRFIRNNKSSSIKYLSIKYNVSYATIKAVIDGKTWRHVS